VLAASGAAALASSPLLGHAQAAWPSKPLRLVVPFAPGGSSEIVARGPWRPKWPRRFGQNVFVENKPGAAGNIAMQEVANSTDEHTMILGHIGTLAVNPYIFSEAAVRRQHATSRRSRWSPRCPACTWCTRICR
jgi:tripartite-type tricarboxylate transporter receptor subunit TctC